MRSDARAHNTHLTRVMEKAARAWLRAMPGVFVARANENPPPHLPLVVLDGVVVDVKRSQNGADVSFRARVEFALRRDNVLRGTLAGAAVAHGTAESITSDAMAARLEGDAVDGAVQSALHRADIPLSLASK